MHIFSKQQFVLRYTLKHFYIFELLLLHKMDTFFQLWNYKEPSIYQHGMLENYIDSPSKYPFKQPKRCIETVIEPCVQTLPVCFYSLHVL